jgi:hypothetical protein
MHLTWLHGANRTPPASVPTGHVNRPFGKLARPVTHLTSDRQFRRPTANRDHAGSRYRAPPNPRPGQVVR